MKLATLMTVIAIIFLLMAIRSAQAEPPQAEPQPGQAAPQAHPESAASAGAGMGMIRPRMMGAPPMAGHPMIPGPSGMMPGGMIDMQFMQMMMNDPKTRARMMEIRGRMMKDMGELMEERGKELQQAK